MSEKKISFKGPELDNHRANNYIIMTLLPVIYLNDQDLSVREYANFLGENMVKTWKQAKDAPISVIAKMIAINYAAAGASYITSQVSPQEIVIRIKNWPPKKLLTFLETDRDSLKDFHYLWEPIANYLEMKFNLKVTENEYLLQFSK
jgi:hypothetical protein